MAEAKGTYIKGDAVYFKDEAARAMISDDYKSTTSYGVGSVCIYNGKLYRATKATTGAWNSASWEAITLSQITNANALVNSSLQIVSFDSSTGELVTKSVS